MTKEKICNLISAAFRGVTLDGGVVWEQTYDMDAGVEPGTYPAPERWESMLNPDWEYLPSGGGFSYLDANGFRFYIAPAMILSLERGDNDEFFAYALTKHDRMLMYKMQQRLTGNPETFDGYQQFKREWDERFEQRLSSLTRQQREAIAAFVTYWANKERAEGDLSCFVRAWDSYWHQFASDDAER